MAKPVPTKTAAVHCHPLDDTHPPPPVVLSIPRESGGMFSQEKRLVSEAPLTRSIVYETEIVEELPFKIDMGLKMNFTMSICCVHPILACSPYLQMKP